MPKMITSEAVEHERVPPELRADPEVRRRMSAPAMRTFFNVTQVWDLTPKEQQGILGWPPSSTFYKYKAGDVAALSLDTLTRISLVLGIFKDLRILYRQRGLADRWVKLPNSNVLFDGNPPVAYMAHGEMDNLYKVRRLLDARRGGWN
jgi:hypothetical protein